MSKHRRQQAATSPSQPPKTEQAASAAVERCDYTRPGLDELTHAWRAGQSVEVATVSLSNALIAGLCLSRTPRTVPLSEVFDKGESYPRALAEDERITVRIVR